MCIRDRRWALYLLLREAKWPEDPVVLADHFPPPSSPPYPCGERCTSYIDAVGIPVVPSPGDVVCSHHSGDCYTNYQDGCVTGESVLPPPSADDDVAFGFGSFQFAGTRRRTGESQLN